MSDHIDALGAEPAGFVPESQEAPPAEVPPAEAAPQAPQPGRRRPPIRLAFVLLVIFIIGAGLSAYVQFKGGVRSALSSIPFIPAPDLTQVFGKQKLRVLVLGIDDNWTDNDIVYTTGARSDTILATSIDLASKNVGIVSIPRDTWVLIPKVGYAKINEAYADAGPQRAEATVEKNFGIPPFDYYLVLKMDATKNIVNALGGVDLNVEKDMDYDDSWGHLHIHLKKGFQHLDGEQAVGYIRFRHDAEGDLGRMRRQRQLIEVLARKLRSPSIALQLPALMNVVRENVRTNMPFDKMFALATSLRDVTPQMVHTAQVPVNVGWTAGESVLFADQGQAQAIVRKYLVIGFGSAFDPSTVHVKVFNGSGAPGAAAAIADYLRQRGFMVVETGNATSFNQNRTTVKGLDQRVAGEVAKQLPMRNVPIAVGPVDGGDIDIVVGRDYRAQ